MEKDNPYAHLIAKAWKDPAFKKKLKTQPFVVLSEHGIKIPENRTVRLVEDDAKTFTIVIPYLPENADQLSEEELSAIVAGWYTEGEGIRQNE